METFIEQSRAFLNPDGTPLLDKQQIKTFLTALRVLGWLALAIHCDISYTYSHIAQHSATPTVSAMGAAITAFKYLLATKNFCLHAAVYAQDRDVSAYAANATSTDHSHNAWRFNTDPDHA